MDFRSLICGVTILFVTGCGSPAVPPQPQPDPVPDGPLTWEELQRAETVVVSVPASQIMEHYPEGPTAHYPDGSAWVPAEGPRPDDMDPMFQLSDGEWREFDGGPMAGNGSWFIKEDGEWYRQGG